MIAEYGIGAKRCVQYRERLAPFLGHHRASDEAVPPAKSPSKKTMSGLSLFVKLAGIQGSQA
jgi:hypothetical protein